jgi:N-methylhydantoinase A/oxoprolinase/acetone carboxylase beta subunit
MRADATPRPLVAVGGAAFLVPDGMPGIARVVRVAHQGVANALGAAIAQVSGEVDQVFQGLSREEALEQARRVAADRAVRAGADPATVTLVDQEDIPIAYLPGNSLRVRARVVGDVRG